MTQQPPPPPNHVVAIYHDERVDPSKPCRIGPAVILAKKGQSILFINYGAAPVGLFWVNVSPFVEPKPALLDSGQAVTLHIDPDIAAGTYPFEAVCDPPDGPKAEGSRPIIIIYDEFADQSIR
jgi:hypothetical protein